MCVGMHVCLVCVYMYVCVHIPTQMFGVYIWMDVCTFVCMYVNTCVGQPAYICDTLQHTASHCNTHLQTDTSQ